MNLIKLLITAAVVACESPWAKMNKWADCDPPLGQVYRPTECESSLAQATK